MEDALEAAFGAKYKFWKTKCLADMEFGVKGLGFGKPSDLEIWGVGFRV